MTGDSQSSTQMYQSENQFFQSELHPLGAETPQTRETFGISPIHSKAYTHDIELAQPMTVIQHLGRNDAYGTRM